MHDSRLDFKLFGQIELSVGGQPVPGPKGKKARMLVGFLAANAGALISREHLSFLLWPDSGQGAARFNLRQLLAAVRRDTPELSHRIRTIDGESLLLGGTDFSVDVLEFAKAANTDPAEAVAMYRGPFLDGLDSDWIASKRSELLEIYISSLESLADISQPRESVRWLRKAAEADPFRESILQRLLVRLCESGDVSGAKIAYRRFRELLHRELHLAPSAETTRTLEELVSRITVLTSPSQTAVVMRHRLPVPLAPILGRDRDISSVRDLLGRARLVTLTGSGGAGKTRLAIEIGEQELAHLPDGAWFTDFSPVTDPAMVLQTIAQAVGVRQHGVEPWLDLLCKVLCASDRLLIFDNCEHLLESCGQAAMDLLSNCGAVRILATSRAPLGVAGEQRFPVHALQTPGTGVTGAEFEGYAAIRMFEACARRSVPDFAINAGNGAIIAEICRCVDGLPLGIEMAAAKLVALSPEKIASKLTEELGFLKGAPRGPRRHRSIQAVMEWSYGLLPESAQTLFPRLAVFSGGWTLEAAESVAGFGSLTPSRVSENLGVLVENSLIRREGDRYSFLDLTRRYSLSLFLASQGQAEIRNRHVVFMTERFKDVLELERGPEAARIVPIYGPDLDNARSALGWCVQTSAIEEALNLVPGVAAAIWKHGYCVEAGAWLEKILALPTTEPASRARILTLQTASWLGPTLACGKASDQLIQVARDIGDAKILALGLALRGDSLVHSDPDSARRLLTEAIPMLAEIDDRQVSRNLSTLGFLETRCGNYRVAAQHLANAAKSVNAREDPGALASIYTHRGLLFRSKCRYEEAVQEFAAARFIYVELGFSLIPLLLDLAELYLDCGDFESLGAILPQCRIEIESRPDETARALLECLTRCFAAHEGRVRDVLQGSSRDLANMALEASRAPGSDWESYIGLHLESLCLCLCSAHEYNEAARFFGAALTARKRSFEFVSPTVERRWDRLCGQFDLYGCMDSVNGGARMHPAEVIEAAEAVHRIVSRSNRIVP